MKPGYPFQTIRVYPVYGFQQARIVWSLVKEFEERPPYQFFVYKSGDGVSNWELLHSDPLIDQISFVDPRIGMFNQDYDLFYRVRLLCQGKEYWSLTQGLYGTLNRNEFLVAREIMRRHLTQMKHRGGIVCFALIRKKSGLPCPDCLDVLAGQPVANQVCTTCFGTGLVGGYETPFLTYAMIVEGEYKLKLDENGLELGGPFAAGIQTIGFPILTRGDIIVKSETDERYDVQVIRRHEIKSFPIIQDCACNKLPVSDIAYKIPVPSYQDLPDPVPA